MMLTHLEARLKERGITLDITEEALATAARNGYDPIYGARPLKRYLQRQIETPIAKLIISGEASDGSTIKVENQGDELIISVE